MNDDRFKLTEKFMESDSSGDDEEDKESASRYYDIIREFATS